MYQSWFGSSGGNPILPVVSRGSLLSPIYFNVWDLRLGDRSYYALVTKRFHSPSIFRDLSFGLQNSGAWSGSHSERRRGPDGAKPSELH